jgi:hypothetical protein
MFLSVRPSVCSSAYSRLDQLAALGEDQGEHGKHYACVQHNNDDGNGIDEAVGGRHRVTQEVLPWHQGAIQSVRPSSATTSYGQGRAIQGDNEVGLRHTSVKEGRTGLL